MRKPSFLRNQKVCKRMHKEPTWKFILRHALAMIGLIVAFYALTIMMFCM